MPIFGVDISHYQAGIDLSRVKAEGFTFVICKVSQGSTFRDSAWPSFRDAARRAGLLLAGYHYIDTSPAARQAANCLGHLGDPTVPVMVDWEAQGGSWANCMAVVNALRGRGLRVPLGYFPRWYWQQQGSPNMSGFDGALVSSRYPSTASDTAAALYRNVTETHWAGYGGLTPTILQFSSNATVAGRPVDANAYRGTREQLAEIFGGSDMPLTPADAQLVANALLDMPLTRQGDVAGSGQPVTIRAIMSWHDAALVNAAGRTQLTRVEQTLANLTTGGVDLDALAAKVADLLAQRLAQ